MLSSSKTLPISEPVDSIASFKTLPRSGLMLRGQLVKRGRPVDLSGVPDSSCWPAPRQRDCQGARQVGWAFGNPTLTDAMLLYHNQPIGKGAVITMGLRPEFIERLVGLPEGWTSVDDVLASEALGIQSSSRKP